MSFTAPNGFHVDLHFMLTERAGKTKKLLDEVWSYSSVVPNNLYDVVALSDDNLVEAIEFKDKKFAIGVQWHPEDLDDEQTNKLFDEFIKKCKE